MSKFDIKVENQGLKSNIHLKGTIDEDVDFSQFNIGTAQEINLYAGHIVSINSCGIREWIKWLSLVKGQIYFHECPKIIVDQINMVDGFLPSGAKVLSFYVPYYNDESGEEKSVLFKYNQDYTDKGEIKAPVGIVDSTGSVMEMDVIEAKYFKFLKK